jgi:hypothetical protein
MMTQTKRRDLAPVAGNQINMSGTFWQKAEKGEHPQ